MKFHDVAWTIATMVSRKESDEFKLIMDHRVPYPLVQYIGRPISEYVLHIPTPEKLVPDEIGLSPLNVIRLRVFRACVAHEGCHIYLTNPTIYETPSMSNRPLANFVSNLIEDCRVETFLASKWAGLGRDIVFANAISYLRLHAVDNVSERYKRVLLAVIMKAFCGRIKGDLSEDELLDVEKIVGILKSVRWSSDSKILLDAVDQICTIVNSAGERRDTTFVFPHHDGKRGWEFHRYVGNRASSEDFNEILKQVSSHLSLVKDFVDTNKDDVAESESIFHQEEISTKQMAHIEEGLKAAPTKFRYVGFCTKDYCEYLRIRDKATPLLKSLENQLAMLTTEIAEVPMQPSGVLDLTEAMQAIASESPKTDVFSRWKVAERGGAWVILLDSSLSMTKNENTIKEIAVTFSQILRNLRPQEQWALYAFSDVFLILKDFDEKCDKSVDSRLGGINCGGATFLPDAIELAMNRLKQIPQDLKVIVVVSDGEPYGYPGIEESMKNTMKRVERGGFTAIGIGFKYRGMNRFFKNYCSVNSVQELPKEFIRQYYAVAGTVEA